VSVFKKTAGLKKQSEANATISVMLHFGARRTDGKKLPLLVLLAAISAPSQLTLPAITVNPSSLIFFATAGQAAPAAIPVSVSSSSAGSTYTAASNQPWLTPTPISNATGGATTVHLSANAASLTAGVYTATVSYAAPNFLDAATAVTFIVTTPSGTFAPATGSPFATGATPVSVATGDFNGDGNPDVVVSNATSNAGNTVTVLLGDGTGGFMMAAGSPFTVGTNPASVAVGDFNGDGNLDIVTANSGDNTVTVLLGNGSGGFTAATGSPFPVGTKPNSVAVADFNGDGNPDLVTANTGGDDVSVLLGNGSGGFTPAAGSPFAVGLFPQSLAVGDFNGDGKPDIVTANSGDNAVRVLLGNGSGGFTGGGAFPAGSFPQSVAVIDFNADGKPDIVAANSGSHSVTVLLGNGSGGFAAATGSPFAVGTNPQSVIAADVNGDGKPDIVTANSGDNTVTVLLGNGLGGFTAAGGSPFAAGATPVSVAAADFNGDGRPDIAIANIGGSTVTVLLGAQATTNSALSTTAASTITYGTSVPLMLAVTGGFSTPAGTGEFLDGGTPIGTAVQTVSPFLFAATGLTAGIHMLTGAYAGDPASAASSSNTVLVTVMPAPQTITFGALSTKTFGAAPFTLTATATSGLAVSFSSTTPLVCMVSASTVTLVSGGACTIQADQPGNTGYAAAASVSQHFTVTPASQTITFGALMSQASGAAPFVVSATASSGLPVSFTSTTLPVCTVAGGIVTLVMQGACTIQASQAGNSSYAAAASVSQKFAVTAAGQTITFSALPDQIIGTAPFALNATASSGLPVSFTSTTLPVCTVATGTVTLLTAGACTIQATQAGDSTYAAAAPVSRKFNVTLAGQAITFAALPDQILGTAAFALSATVSSGLTVSFKSTTTPVCTVAAAVLTLVTAGTCTIQASQAGNSSFAPATPVIQSFNVTPASQTITFGALSNQVFGTAAMKVSATASSNLAVSFASLTASVCTVATATSGATVTLVSVGSCTIEASQAGNSGYATATPVVQTFTVTQGSQTITFGALSNKAFGTAPFTIMATASSGLAVTFASNSDVCAVSGATSGATVTLAIGGTCTIQASQPGNANYTAAVAVPQSFTVTPASQTITFGALTNQPFGAAPLTLGATASSGLGVIFTSTTSSVCTIATAMVTLVGVGTCTIQATQPGNSNYAAAASVSQHFTVTPASQTIAFGAIPNQELGTGQLALNATASSGLAVTFKSTTLAVCTVSGTILTLLIKGPCTIQAMQAGNANYAAAASVSQTFTVAAAVLTIGSVLNAASYAAIPIASDGYTVAFGTDFSAGATVTVADSNGLTLTAQLIYVSPTQINFLVPEGLANGSATVTVANSAGVKVSFATSIAQVSPALFTADSSGTGAPAAIALAYASGAAAQVVPVFNCTASPLVCTAAPIDLGPPSTSVYLELFGTGIRGRTSLSTVSVTLGGIALQVTYAGAQNTYPGLDQVNVLLDRSLIGGGMLTLQLMVDGIAANPVTVSIQ
jgi:uncharacterized protein (TIGR03437 family)